MIEAMIADRRNEVAVYAKERFAGACGRYESRDVVRDRREPLNSAQPNMRYDSSRVEPPLTPRPSITTADTGVDAAPRYRRRGDGNSNYLGNPKTFRGTQNPSRAG
jgi:hypothetical protein